jgi:lipopolysaccharide transport system permease protein
MTAQGINCARCVDETDGRRELVIRPAAFSLRGLLADISGLAHYRDLLYTLTLHRIKVRYKQSVLGVTWAIIQPLSMVVIFTAVFSRIARVPSEGLPYPLFAFVALLPWNYFSTAVVNSTNGLVNHANLITKVYFPRELLPLTYVFAAFFDLLIASGVLGLLLVYYQVPLTWHALYAIPLIVILSVFIFGVALLMSAVQVRFRDIGLAVPLLLQVWMLLTPLIYPLSEVPARFRPAYILNPMVGIIEGFRLVLLHGTAPDWPTLSISVGISAGLLLFSYMYFKRIEATMADII